MSHRPSNYGYPNNTLSRLGMNVRYARLKAQLTGKELSELVEMSEAGINRIENANRAANIWVYMMIADTLHVSLGWLFDHQQTINEHSEMYKLAEAMKNDHKRVRS